MNSSEETLFMKPSDILFSKEEIPSRFADHGDLHQVIAQLTLHPKLVNTIPLMAVSNRNDGEWHSENNRRLYVFRVLEKNGTLETVQVKVSQHLIFPFVTDDGCHVRFRGKIKTLHHCNCDISTSF